VIFFYSTNSIVKKTYSFLFYFLLEKKMYFGKARLSLRNARRAKDGRFLFLWSLLYSFHTLTTQNMFEYIIIKLICKPVTSYQGFLPPPSKKKDRWNSPFFLVFALLPKKLQRIFFKKIAFFSLTNSYFFTNQCSTPFEIYITYEWRRSAETNKQRIKYFMYKYIWSIFCVIWVPIFLHR